MFNKISFNLFYSKRIARSRKIYGFLATAVGISYVGVDTAPNGKMVWNLTSYAMEMIFYYVFGKSLHTLPSLRLRPIEY